MGKTAADPRERRRVLQTGGKDPKPKPASSKAERSGLPGFGTAAAAGSVAKRQQAKSSKLNTPTKKYTTPPPAAAPAAAAGGGGILHNRDASQTAAVAAAAVPLAGDPYEFPADDCEDEDVQRQQQQAGTAAGPAKQQQQQPRAAAAAGTKPKPSGRLGAIGALGYHGIRGGINNSSASRQLFSGVSGAAHNSSAAAAGFATAGTVVSSTAGGQAARVKKQVDIRGFTEPLPLLSSPTRYNGKLPAGMLNHGNTCYLNAVLQALLSLPCLARDLTGDSLAQLPLPQHGVTLALQTCLKQHTASCGAISPAAVSAAMAQLSARWGSCRQEDAHEFLTALLEAVQTEVLAAQVRQLKSSAAHTSSNDAAPSSAVGAAAVEAADCAMPDAHAEAEAEPHQDAEQQAAAAAAAAAEPTGLAAVAAEQADAAAGPPAATAATAAGSPRLRVSAVLCPASRNFSGCLQHTLTCSECGHVTLVKEQFNHLSLDLPAAAGAGSGGNAAGGSGSAPGSPARGAGQQQQGAGAGGDGELKWLLSGGVGQQQAAAAGCINSSEPPLVPDLQALLANFFAPESLEKACEACGAASAQHSLTHAVRRLPRVLVVHLKRFQWQVLPGGGAICRKLSTRVRPDRQLHLGAVCCPGRPVPPLVAELMPAGLLQAADAACSDTPGAAEPCGDSSLAGSKRSRPSTWDCEADPQQQQQQQQQAKQLAKGLSQSWAAAAAAGGGDASKPAQQGQQSRLGRMSQADPQQHQQHGPGFNKKQLTLDSKLFGSKGDVFTGARPDGGRHTDLTQVQHDQQQQRSRKRSRSPQEEVIRASGELCIEAADADGADCFGLPRNNSSTQVDLVGVDEEEDDLQRAIKASLLTAAQEGHPTDAAGCLDAAQPGSSMPDLKHGNNSCMDKATAPGAAATQPELEMPQWMDPSGGSGAVVDCSTPPSTPKSQSRAPAPLASRLDDNLHGWVRAGDSKQQQQQQQQRQLTGWGSASIDGWAAREAKEFDAMVQREKQQQRAGSGRLSGGAAGLSDGLAFSDERPAAPRSQQGERCMPAGTPFAGLPRLGLAGSSSGLGGLAPGSPPRSDQPQPARGRNVSNSSGAGGPFANHKNAAAAAAAAAGGGSGGGGAAGGVEVISLLDGVHGMSEEQQLKRAMELSLMESAAAAGGGTSKFVLFSSGGAAGGLAGLVDKDSYDEEAALQKALEESAAAAEMQQQLQLQEVAGVEAAEQQQGSDEAGVAGQQQQQQQQQQQGAGADAPAGSGDAAAGAAAADDDDDAVVVAESGAGGDGGQQQQQQRQRLPLVRLVEDSDCEDEDAQAALTAAAGAGAADEQAAPPAAAGRDTSSMQVDQAEPEPAAAAAAAAVDQQQVLGKENQEDHHQQQHGAAGTAAISSKPKRRPLGEVLCSRDAARTNSVRGRAQAAPSAAAPVKQPRLAAAVAASEAAAAAAAVNGEADGSGQAGGELQALHAAAAAQAAGAWPQASAALYRLRAVVRHKGPLASSGHFVSEVLSDQQGGQWFHYDDSFVHPTKLEAVVARCEGDGYLFFYSNSAILGSSIGQQQQ